MLYESQGSLKIAKISVEILFLWKFNHILLLSHWLQNQRKFNNKCSWQEFKHDSTEFLVSPLGVSVSSFLTMTSRLRFNYNFKMPIFFVWISFNFLVIKKSALCWVSLYVFWTISRQELTLDYFHLFYSCLVLR